MIDDTQSVAKGVRLAAKDARQELVDLLNDNVFNPILNASRDKYKRDADRQKLQDLQSTTRSTQESYEKRYKTAEKVVEMYRDDLSSDAAKKVQEESRDLGLPTLPDVKAEFEKKAQELGVK
jgi:hypothetical protein